MHVTDITMAVIMIDRRVNYFVFAWAPTDKDKRVSCPPLESYSILSLLINHIAVLICAKIH